MIPGWGGRRAPSLRRVDYVIIALATYWLALVLKEIFDAPRWFWFVLMAAGACGAMWLVSMDDWWWGLSVPTMIIFLNRVDDLLLAAGDWLRVTVMRTTRTR